MCIEECVCVCVHSLAGQRFRLFRLPTANRFPSSVDSGQVCPPNASRSFLGRPSSPQVPKTVLPSLAHHGLCSSSLSKDLCQSLAGIGGLILRLGCHAGL